MAPVSFSSLFLMFLISLFNLYGAVSISIAISIPPEPNSKLKIQNSKLLPLQVFPATTPGHP
mgnify:CR=1 FL=1